jgi:hypothetical protein
VLAGVPSANDALRQWFASGALDRIGWQRARVRWRSPDVSGRGFMLDSRSGRFSARPACG